MNTRKHNTVVKILSGVLVIAVLVAAFPAQPAAAAASATSADPRPVLGIKEFARCVVNDLKILPQAKKLTPQGYQNLEKLLNTSFTVAGLLKGNQYIAAILLGAKIGKFIGYDLVWGIGIVQDCWGQLRR